MMSCGSSSRIFFLNGLDHYLKYILPIPIPNSLRQNQKAILYLFAPPTGHWVKPAEP